MKLWTLPVYLVLVLLCVGTITQPVRASPGSLDASFGQGGVGLTSLGTSSSIDASAVALQSDGKIVTAGYYFNSINDVFGLVRFGSNGLIDLTFGSQGIASAAIGTSGAFDRAVAVQPDGKILAVGNAFGGPATAYNFAIARFNADGSLDKSFGPSSNGTVQFDFFGQYDQARSVMIQADGKILVFGQATSGGTPVFAGLRLTTSGILDTGFGTGGKVSTTISTSASLLSAILQSDGKIVAVGASVVSGINHFTVVRYNPDGSLDSSFGSSGIATTTFGSNFDIAFSVAQQADGKLVAAGYSYTGSAYVYAIARYNADGSPDSSFGSGGKLTIALGPQFDFADNVIVQVNGKILVSGYTYTGVDYVMGLVRYNSDGSLDTSFGNGGKVFQSLGTIGAIPNAGLLQPDGKIVLAGDSQNQVFVARFQGDPPVDNVPPTWATGSNLTATILSPTSVILSWTPATDNVAVTGYRVYQGTTLIANLPSTSSSYVVTGLTQGSSYNFKVQAGDAANNWSTTGPSASATLPAPPSFLTANLPWLILIAVVIGFGVALVLTKPKAPKMG